jgi:hypothetical protein
VLASGKTYSVQSTSEVISSMNNDAPENVNEESQKPVHRMKTSDIEQIKQGASGM